MFFFLSKSNTCNHPILTKSKTIQNWNFQSDNGWSQINHILYKGYSLGKSVYQKVTEKDFSECPGNYCIIEFVSEVKINIYTDDSRSFPLHLHNNSVFNLCLESYDKSYNIFPDSTTIWVDGGLNFSNGKWNFSHLPDKKFVYESNHVEINFDQTVDLICNHMLDQVQALEIDKPLMCGNSSGVDSTLVRSAFDYLNIPYTMVYKNRKDLKKILDWGYGQMYSDDTPHIQITGFCGDEVFLRNPQYCHWMLTPRSIDLHKEYKKQPNAYMTGFYQNKYQNKVRNDNKNFTELADALEKVYNVVSNDFQMWHLNHTITFTPFRNLTLLKSLMYADADTIVKQCIHGEVSKAAIARLCKNNLFAIKPYKNDYMPAEFVQ